VALRAFIHQIPWRIPIASGTRAIDILLKDACISNIRINTDRKYLFFGIGQPRNRPHFRATEESFFIPKPIGMIMKVSISSTELEILRKSAEGRTVQQIANELNVSHQVIIRSKKEILLRTGAENPVNALQAVAKRGFVLTEERIR
jgi:DNA-binding CsgD family transcriptional regulator